MESSNLTPQPDANLDAILRAAGAPLADDGFSQRVLAALPAPALPRWITWGVPMTGALIGLGWVLNHGASVADGTKALQTLTAAATAPGILIPGAVILAAVVWLSNADDAIPDGSAAVPPAR
jgi:hypothetical protein